MNYGDLTPKQKLSCGIYKMQFGNKVYVGQSNQLIHRIHQRIANITNQTSRQIEIQFFEQLKLTKTNIDILENPEILECEVKESDLATKEMTWIKHFYEAGFEIINTHLNDTNCNADFWFCSVCKEYKSKSDFYIKNRKHSRPSFESKCKKCELDRFNRYKAKNREKVLTKNKEYKQKHKERIAVYTQKYNHSEAGKISQAKYRAKNRDKINQRKRQYRAKRKALGLPYT